jgi:hypothetical protein
MTIGGEVQRSQELFLRQEEELVVDAACDERGGGGGRGIWREKQTSYSASATAKRVRKIAGLQGAFGAG